MARVVSPSIPKTGIASVDDIPYTYIYGLVDPETEQIRYIGKTINPTQRLSGHLNEPPVNCHRSHWIQSLKLRGKQPRMVFLEAFRGEADWQYVERWWIAMAKSKGWPLTNNTSGGDGVPDLPEQTRERIRSTWIGRKHSDETKSKIGAATSARRHSAETKFRMSQTRKGRKIAWVEKISEVLRKLSEDDISDIRRRIAVGEKVKDLAIEYGVHRTTISKVKKGVYEVFGQCS